MLDGAPFQLIQGFLFSDGAPFQLSQIILFLRKTELEREGTFKNGDNIKIVWFQQFSNYL